MIEGFKRNQVEEAIFRTLHAKSERIDELKLRLKRLLVTDRRLGVRPNSVDEEKRCYAFYSQRPPGSGTEIMFSGYEAFALLAATMLLEHGLPQATVVQAMRRARKQFEAAYARTMQKDPNKLFDQKAVWARAEPGMIAVNNTDPVFLVLVGLTGSSVEGQTIGSEFICEGHDGLGSFLADRSSFNRGATIFEFTGSMHQLMQNLLQTRPLKRGRATT